MGILTKEEIAKYEEHLERFKTGMQGLPLQEQVQILQNKLARIDAIVKKDPGSYEEAQFWLDDIEEIIEEIPEVPVPKEELEEGAIYERSGTADPYLVRIVELDRKTVYFTMSIRRNDELVYEETRDDFLKFFSRVK